MNWWCQCVMRHSAILDELMTKISSTVLLLGWRFNQIQSAISNTHTHIRIIIGSNLSIVLYGTKQPQHHRFLWYSQHSHPGLLWCEREAALEQFPSQTIVSYTSWDEALNSSIPLQEPILETIYQGICGISTQLQKRWWSIWEILRQTPAWPAFNRTCDIDSSTITCIIAMRRWTFLPLPTLLPSG